MLSHNSTNKKFQQQPRLKLLLELFTRGYIGDNVGDGLYQEFLPGFDITTPIVYNPLKQDYDIFPSIIYLPYSEDLNWFFGANEKSSGTGYCRGVIPTISEQLKEKYFDLVRAMGIRTFCRVDARIRCDTTLSPKDLQGKPLSMENLYFIEINPMPTVKHNNSFGFCYSAIAENDSFFPCLQAFKEVVSDATVHSFAFWLQCSH